MALTSLGLVPYAHAAGEKIEGRVYDESNNKGIGGFTVRLKAPKDSDEAERLQITDAEGKFSFTELHGRKYLLEVSQGREVLYRKEILVPTDKKVEIPLRKGKK
jgi:hypothetical protein